MTEAWNDDFTLNHARTALLTSVFLFEIDVSSAAMVWHGSSVRIAQDMGLHCESGPWPVLEGEMRRRVWWAIYLWDRLLSLELSRPPLIDDEDCTVDLPQATEDRYIQERGGVDPREGQNTSIHLAAIHTLRFASPLRQLQRSSVVSSMSLRAFDTNFATCLAVFPPECQRSSDPGHLDPRHLSALAYLHNTRILLHRHNLTNAAPCEARVAALDNCALAARDTTALLHRAMRNPPPTQEAGPPWTYLFSTAATSLLCTHIWRCALILSFRAFYSEALVCLKAMETIGDQVAVNAACGESLALFLKALVERVRRGQGSQIQLQTDEEMLVYVSGDLQASPENGWVWQATAGPPSGLSSVEEQARRRPQSVVTSGGWNKIREALEGLIREQHAQRPPPQPVAKSSSRISIANIM
ncbi:MAG: hypothetical protein M1814_005562 [Vezdaea aestivalis]|nr:MAG: hypothetical protein M1814_005562 [Vezdaea aestivalis]